MSSKAIQVFQAILFLAGLSLQHLQGKYALAEYRRAGQIKFIFF